MKKKKKRKHHRYKKPFQLQTTPRPAVNSLQQSIEAINRLKPVMAAVQRAAARQRERERKLNGPVLRHTIIDEMSVYPPEQSDN